MKDIELPSGEKAQMVALATSIINASANFTRVADNNAYVSGDLVANSVTAGSVTPMTFAVGRNANSKRNEVTIKRVKIKKSNATVTNASFRLHLYTALPTVTNGDNGVWLSIESGYIGFVDVTVDKAFSDAAAGVAALTAGAEINVILAGSQNIYGLLEARAGYGGAAANAEVFTITLEGSQI